MRNYNIAYRVWFLLLLAGLWAGSAQAQQGLVRQSMSLGEYNASKNGSGLVLPATLQGQLEQGAFMPGALMVQLDLGGMLTNEPVVIELDGKRFPVVKSHHWIDPEHPEAYSVFGYLKGDKSLPFFYNRAPDGREHLTFQSPQRKYYFSPVEGDWFLAYSYDPAFEAEVSCGEGEAHPAPRIPVEDLQGEASAKGAAGSSACKLRTVFLYTDQVEVNYTTLSNALNQNISYINANVLQNGNGRNPVITSHASQAGCQFGIERVALIRADQNAYGNYTEQTCPVEGNGNVMRDQMRDGLAGQGDLAWLQTVRKDYAADLVVLLTSNELRSSNGSCSSGPNLNGIAGGIGVGGNGSVIVQRAVGTFLDGSFNADPTNLTLIHELGHNLGCAHEGQDATYQGYCDAAGLQKTIMHTLGGTAPCNGGVNQRRAVFSHNIHTFSDAAAAGSPNHLNASAVGSNFDAQAEFFEDSNWGSNDLAYSGDFNNNSGRTRSIDTPGYVVLSYARNSGNNYVWVKSAEYVFVTGEFSSRRILLSSVPNNAGNLIQFAFDEVDQEASLEAALEGDGADRILSALLYPNPSQGDVTLSWFQSGSAQVSVRLFNSSGLALGEVLLDAYREAGDNELSLPVADLAAGLYFVEIRAGDEQEVLRLVRY